MLRILALLLAACALVLGSPAHAASKTDERLDNSLKVFETFANLSEQAIPTWLLEGAYGVVVVPAVIDRAGDPGRARLPQRAGDPRRGGGV